MPDISRSKITDAIRFGSKKTGATQLFHKVCFCSDGNRNPTNNCTCEKSFAVCLGGHGRGADLLLHLH